MSGRADYQTIPPNDFSFYDSDLYLTLLDPHRAGDELNYYPSEVNLRLADVAIINKIDSAAPEGIQQVRENIQKINPKAIIIDAASPIRVADEVYSAGMMGQLCDGDGRTRSDASQQYGSGGALAGKKYMISLTFNAPRGAFDDPEQFFFEGRSVDDLFWPTHLNFRFFGMEGLETFACYDVMKNPDIEGDFKRFRSHLERLFPRVSG